MPQSARTLVFALGRAQVLARLLQLLVPVLLTRLLDVTDFGYYRFFWLFVNTVMAFAPLGVPRSLYYYLPRVSKADRSVYVNQGLLVLSVAGIVVATGIGPWSPLRPQLMVEMDPSGYVVMVFIVLWTASYLVEVLPAAGEDIRWQAASTTALAIARAGLVLAAAWFTRDVHAVLLVLVAYALVRLAVLLWYVIQRHGGRLWAIRIPVLLEQVRYSLPFGVTAGLQNVRPQVDQWVVAMLFQAHAFAVFSVAGLASQLLEVSRSSVVSVVLPRMNRAHAMGDVRRIVALNSNSNLAIGAAVLPALAFLFIFAEECIRLLFTDAYVSAAPAMRLYLVGMAVLTIEMTSVLSTFNEGTFILKLGVLLFVLSVLGSYGGASVYGVTGAAFGSVLGTGADCLFKLARVRRVTGLPFRELQDWRGIGAVAASAVAAAMLAWLLVQMGGVLPDLPLVAVAALITALSYLALLRVTGQGWLIRAYVGKSRWQRPER